MTFLDPLWLVLALAAYQLVLRVGTGNPAGPVAGRIAGRYTEAGRA